LGALLVKSTQLVPQTVSPFEQPLDADWQEPLSQT